MFRIQNLALFVVFLLCLVIGEFVRFVLKKVIDMPRPHKILLLLSDQELERLLKVRAAFQVSSVRKVSKSDVLRKALFSLPFQGVLFS